MNNLSNKIPQLTLAFAIMIGLVLAIFMGRGIGQGDTKPVAIIIGLLAAMAVYLTLGKNAWMLMLFCLPLTGKISVLPLPFSVHDLGIFAAFAAFLASMIFKRKQNKPLVEKIDILLWINVAWLGFAFLRNPVGVAALGSDLVGGLPYQNVVLAICAFFVLRQVVVSPKMAPKVPFFMFGGELIVSFLGVLTTYIPSLVPFIAPFYSGISVNTYLQKEVQGTEADTTLGETRLTPLYGVASTLATYSVTRWKPSTLFSIMHPGRFLLYAMSILAIFYSGFRSGLFQLLALFAISSFMQEKFPQFVRNVLVVVLGLVLLICASFAGIPLPKTFQRALSFLPGDWDREAVAGANDSSEWRFTMWKLALTTDKYIHNKVLGDGFGFPASELKVMQSAAWGGIGYLGEDRAMEAYMIQGTFHSGPVTTIRVVGYVGLALFLPLLVALATYAWNLANMTRGSPFQFPALFMAVGAVLSPFYFVFIFGNYGDSLPGAFIGLGSMKMIKLSYLKWAETQLAATPSVSQPATHPTAAFSPV